MTRTGLLLYSFHRMVSGARGIPEYGRLYRNMGEYRTSEVRQSGTAEGEEEGGEEGGERYIYIRISKIYTEKRTRRKKMERNRPELAGRGGSGGFWSRCQEGPDAEGLADVRKMTITARVMGEHNSMQIVWLVGYLSLRDSAVFF